MTIHIIIAVLHSIAVVMGDNVSTDDGRLKLIFLTENRMYIVYPFFWDVILLIINFYFEYTSYFEYNKWQSV